MFLQPSLQRNNLLPNAREETMVKQIPPQGQIGWLLQWRDLLLLPRQPLQPGSFESVEAQDITKVNLQEHGADIQALYLNIDWSKTSMDSFREITISDKLMSSGMVFVWVEKQNMAEVKDHFEKSGISLVEIFTMVFLSLQKIRDQDKPKSQKGTLLSFFQKNVQPAKAKTVQDYLNMSSHQFPALTADQVMYKGESHWLRKSKRNLLLLRKFNKKEPLELRHQRTSDIFFTLFDEEKQQMDPKAEECVYKMIETLLIKANYSPGQKLRMIELWAKPAHKREGWISISQRT